MTSKMFVVVLMILDISAAVAYAIDGNVKKVIYWIAAAVINAAVTF